MTRADVERLNRLAARFGLLLTPDELNELAQHIARQRQEVEHELEDLDAARARAERAFEDAEARLFLLKLDAARDAAVAKQMH
jgi:hypothetical protein